MVLRHEAGLRIETLGFAYNRVVQSAKGKEHMRKQSLKIRLVGLVLLSAAAAFGLEQRLMLPRPVTPAEVNALRLHTPPGMAAVPGGECWLGSDDEDADEDVKPKRRVHVSSYYIDVHEVTNEEFRRFDANHTFMSGLEKLPATNITCDRAAAYAKWAGKRLPTEAEWEKAARGTDGRRYPWGDIWDAKKVAPRARRGKESAPPSPPANGGKFCFLGPARTQPVGSVPSGISPYGCTDMAGNAWEWVQGSYNGNPDQRILRGGAVGYGERACRTYNRAIEGAGDT